MLTGEPKRRYQREYMRKRREAQKTASINAPQSTNSIQSAVLDPPKQTKTSVISTISDIDVQDAFAFWRRNPIRYLVDCLDVKEEHVWPKMVEMAESVRDNQKTCIEAGHSVSKDYTMSRLAIWFLECYGPNCTVVISGPGNNQVENVFFREVAQAYNRAKKPVLGKLTSCKLDIDDKWFMIGFTAAEDPGTDENTRTQGFHNEYVLVILTEDAGVPLSVRKAVEGLIITGKHRLVVYGNPTKAEGHFAEDAQDPAFHYINISVLDTPNYKEGREVVPGLSGREYVDGIEKKYGKDSNEYKVRVLGVRPEFSEGTYLGRGLAKAETDGRIGSIAYEDTSPVYTFTDIGDMYSAWWFVQFVREQVRIIDFYYDSQGVGFPGYALMLQERKYKYGGHFSLPDIFKGGSNQKAGASGQYSIDIAHSVGIDFECIDIPNRDDCIRAGQDILNVCWFSSKAQEGLDGLKDWRKRKNDQLSTPDKPVYFEEAVKSWGRHAGDAWCGLGVAYRYMSIGGEIRGSLNIRPQEIKMFSHTAYSTGRVLSRRAG